MKSFCGLLFVATALVISSVSATPVSPPKPEPRSILRPRALHPITDGFDNSIDNVAVIEVPEARQEVDYRLPSGVIPLHYDLELTPYFQAEGSKAQFTFDGVADIRVRADQAVNSIILHIYNMTVTSWSVTTVAGVPVPHGTESYDTVTDKLTMPLNTPLQSGLEYIIHFTYIGVIQEEMAGFYRSYYKENGNTKWLGTTQFEQTDARRAFPCFDEPKFKATFQLTINRPSNFSPSISNTVIEETTAGNGGRIKEKFAKTPKMSTYLLAFIVSEYSNKTNAAKNFGVYARPQGIEHFNLGLEFGPDITARLGDWLGLNYYSVPEMTKLDMAAIPDFSAGAMENWGLLTYRESSSLYDPNQSTANNRQRIVNVITHEIAHQWFGDLLTCEWWDVTWLNEGFARYFQYFGTAWIQTSWDLETQFVVDQLQGVFQLDSTAATHPMTYPVNSQSEASAIFDNISYNKGASILRMVEHYMGKAAFQNGIKHYIANNMYRSVRPEDLFTSLELQTPGVTAFMASWTVQPGYPTVTVEVHNEYVLLSQRRFLLNENNHNDLTRYNIPITFATTGSQFASTTVAAVMTREEPNMKNVSIPLASRGGKYFIMNNQQVGYYRVNYDVDNWMAISEALMESDHGGIHVLNRAQLVDDLFNFARGQIVDYETAMNIINYIRSEKNYAPWLSAFNGLSYLERRVKTADRAKFSNYILYLLEDIYEYLTFYAKTTDSVIDKFNRNNVLNWACKHGHEGCINTAVEEFQKYTANPATYRIDPDLRATVYCNAIRYGNSSEFTTLWNKYLNENLSSEQITILTAMGCARDRASLEIYFNAILSDNIRQQDKSSAFGNLYQGNPENVDIAYDLVTENFQRYGEYLSITSALNNLASRFTTQEQVNKMRTFATTYQSALGTPAYNAILSYAASAEKNLDWDAEFIPNVIDVLGDISGVGVFEGSAGLIFTLVAAVILKFIF